MASGNLPLALSSFIGRGREIMEVKRLLAATRLLTLTGPGGSGKTRLALWVAAELTPTFAGGAWLVELAPLADPALVPQTVLAALGLGEQPGQPAAERLTDHLRPRRLLLVLDNCEHLVAACAALAESLLRACPNLCLLATSREPLNVAGETVWAVPPLSVPAAAPGHPALSAAQAMQSEAVRLFVERASAATPAFALTDANAPAVASVCRQIDGIPLAVELAAARVRALSVEQIADRLAHHEGLRLLSAGRRTAPPRQQTLAAALDWSHALLDDAERQVLRRLAVFAGGCTLEAAEAVCAGAGVLDTLSRLVDKSLVLADHVHGAARYRLLETIRQYAHDKLVAAGELEATRDRHLEHFVQFATEAEPGLYDAQQFDALRRYVAEHDNLRAALEHGRARPALGLRLAAACGRFWRLHGDLTEGRARLSAAVEAARAHPPYDPATFARVLFLLGGLVYLQSDFPAGRRLFEESLALWQSLGPAGEVGTAEALSMLAETATEEGDYATAPRLFEQALAVWRRLGHKRGHADVLIQLGWVGLRTGDFAGVVPRFEEALSLFREIGDNIYSAFCLAGLGEAAVRQGQYDRAGPLLEESLAVRRLQGDKWGMGTSLGSLGWLALLQGDARRMRAYLAESLAVRLETGDKSGIAWCLEKLAEANLRQAQAAPSPAPATPDGLRRAARLYAAAAALRAPVRSVMDPVDLPEHERNVAALQAALGQPAFDEAWAEGIALPVEQAIAQGLAEPPTPTAGLVPNQPASGPLSLLTPRERQVVALLAQGKSNRDIAAALVVGHRTVETYISRILSKLGFTSRLQVATWALEQGLIEKQ